MADLMIPTSPSIKLTTPSSTASSSAQQQGVVGAIRESSSVTESHHNQNYQLHHNHHHSPLLNLSCTPSSGGGEETSSPSPNGTILIPHPQNINNGSSNHNNNGQQMDESSTSSSGSTTHNFSNNLNISSASSSPGAPGGLLQHHSRNHSHPLIFSTSANNNNVDSSSTTTTGLKPEMALPNNISSTLPSSSSVATMDILNLDFVNGNSSYSHQQNNASPLSKWPQQSHSTATTTKGDQQQSSVVGSSGSTINYHNRSGDPCSNNNNSSSQSTTLGSSTPGGDSTSANIKVVPGEIPESVMKYLKSDSVDSPKSSAHSSTGSTPSSSSEHQNRRLQEFLVDLDTLQSTSEIAKVLENFNAILERIEQEEDKEALEGLEALTTPLSPTVLQCPTATVSSTSRIKNSVETLADLLLSGCGDEEDEDLLIIIDENDSESLQAGAPLTQHQLQMIGKERSLDAGILIERDNQAEEEELEDDVSSLVEIETELGDLDQEEGYESDRPIVRASMRKLRPVKLLPMPSGSSSSSHHHHHHSHQHNSSNSGSNSNANAFSTPPPTPVTPRACSPVDPGAGHTTSINSPIANKIIVTSLMNNLSSSPQSEIRTTNSDASSSSPISTSAVNTTTASTCSSAALASAINSIVPTATLEVLHVSSASAPGHSRNQSNSSQVIQFHQNPVTLTTNPTGFVEVNIGNPSGNNISSSGSSQQTNNGQRVNGGNLNSTSGTLAGSSNSTSSASNNVQSTECRAPTSSPACIPSSNGNTSGGSNNSTGSRNGGANTSASPSTGNGSTPTNASSNNSSSNNTTSNTATSGGGSRPRGRAPQAPSTTQQRANSNSRVAAGRWPHRLSSVLAVIGCTLGLNNICRFSLLSVQYGANFVLQFIFLSIVFGIPLLTFHMSIGQYLSSGIIDMWKISPIFQGIGVGLVISQAMIGIYTTVGVSWIFIYFRDSFITRQDQYRWGKCIREFEQCDPQFGNNTSVHMYNETVPGYFNAVVLQRTSPDYPDSAYVPSSLKFTVAFNLAVVWMLVFVSLSKGLKSYGKVVHGFVLAPVAALFVLAFKMVNLVPPGGSLFGQTKWSSFFFSSQTWVAAARETFFTWGLLGACVMQITAHNRRTHSLKSDSLIVIMVTMIVLMLSAFIGNACHSILTTSYYASPDTPVQFNYVPSSFESKKTYRFLEEVQNQNVEEPIEDTYDYHHISFLMGVRVIKQGSGADFHQRSGYQVLRLATELFPATMAVQSQNGMSSFWTVLFYFAFVLFGIAQQIAIWHCVIKGIIAVKGKVLRSWETTITFFVCGLGFVLALPLCTETGIFIEYFMDYAIGSGWWIMVLYLLELIAVFIVRGAPYCGENIVTVLITGRNRISAVLAPLISFIWNVIMPVAILVLSIASFKNGNIRELYDWNPKHGYRFWPSWTREIGSLIQLVPILAVPFVAILQSCRYLSTGPPDLFDRMQQLYRPNSQGLFGNNLSGSFNENGGSDSSSGRNGNSRGPEDPPPKYTPPPSYSTATGAKIAKFLRNSFRRSLRRLSSPGGPSTSSASPDNLPAPPNYASVILEINSQRNHQSSSCAVSVVPPSSLMNPIMVPPPSYDETIRSSATATTSSNRKDVDGNGGESSKLYQIQLSQTLGRSLAEGSKERASLRRIASDITSRDIARMLRQSLRRGANRDSPEASTSASAAAANALTHGASSYSTNSSPGQGIIVTIPATPSLVETNGGNPCEYTFGPNSIEKVEYDLEMLNDFSHQHDGQLPPNIPPNCTSAAHSRQGSSSSTTMAGGNGAFGFNFSFNRARNRNSNDSQLALITNGLYEDLSVTSGGFMGALVDNEIEVFNLPPRRDSLSQLNVLDLERQGNANPTFQINNTNANVTTSSAGAGTTQVDRAADSEA